MRGVASKRKWETEKQIPDATRILTALVTASKRCIARVAKLDEELALQEKSPRCPLSYVSAT